MDWNLLVPVMVLAAAPRLPAGAGLATRPPGVPAHTFSIVARDPATGELGVAVPSHYFSVRPLVRSAEARVAPAAILVVSGKPSGKPWADRVMDLRVEDSPEPIKELRRLVRLRRAYNYEDAGDNAISAKNPEEALRMYEKAASLAPDVVELQFWAAISMYTNQREKDALALFRKVFAREARW